MKVFVTGAAGQLGHDVTEELARRGHEAVGSDIAASDVLLDITDAAAVKRVIGQIRPDAVMHCAAWTAVDAAEEADNAATVRAVNVDGTANLAAVCRQWDCKMLYLSTDYVFDGQGTRPWEPDCKDFHPLNVYGKTKLEGEFAVADTLDKFFIVRIAWVFGTNGQNFIKTMLRLGSKVDTLRVVNDQIGTPTYTFDLARLLVDMIETERYGYYHVTNEGGFLSWYEFALEIFRQAVQLGHEEYAADRLSVQPVTTEEYGESKAARPFNSRLDKSKLSENGFVPLPSWQDALHRFLLTEQAFSDR